MAPVVCRILVLAALCSHLPRPGAATGAVNGFISFAVPHLAVEEDTSTTYTSVQIPFTRTGGTVGNVVVTFEVVNSTAQSDFLDTTSSAFFLNGITSTTGSLIVQNDVIPEGNETFLLRIIDARFGAEVGSANTMLLTVIASDDPYGQLQFNQSYLQVTADEPLSGVLSQAMIEVVRGPGVFGSISVQYQVVSGQLNGVNDISPTQGQLNFANEERSKFIIISVLPDDIPENDEVFTIRLVNPTGGATLAASNTESQLTVSANDSPVRFADSVLTVGESDGAVMLTVYRGLLSNGVQVGPLNSVTTVQYSTSSGTATGGADFVVSSGTVQFSIGSAARQISIPIINDTAPEGDETFLVTLSNPSSDSVLVSPQSSMVTISVNDNAGGVIRFKSTSPVIISEDDETAANLIIERTVGTVNDVAIAWSIQDSQGNLATSDFNPISGTVTIPNGQSEATLTITAINDVLPEEAELFMVSIDAVIGGNGELDMESLRVTTLYIEDSDNVYGLVQIPSSPTNIIVNPPNRVLVFPVSRSGGTVGQITVDYSITYLAPGATVGTAGQVTADGGSVTITAGQSQATVTVPIFTTAFTEPGAQLRVEINGTEISGGVVPLLNTTNSPHIGNLSTTSVIFSTAASSGFIGFSNASQTVTTTEPASGVSSLLLSIERGGSFGSATIIWSITAVTPSFVRTQDVVIPSGTISIADGQTSVNLEILVAADIFPELDEAFVVTLLSVSSNGNQNLSPDRRVSSITISSNDNPEGTFYIANSTQGPFFINEDNTGFASVIVLREGGSLTLEQIQYRIIPANTNDFIGPTGVLFFNPGDTTKNIPIAPVLDSIPETNETFTLELFSPLGKTQILGSPTTVTITILANDDYNGVFSFTDPSRLVGIDEPLNPGSSGTVQSSANFVIQRAEGLFGPATVYWMVEMNDTTDITPLQGSVQFSDGAVSNAFQISALPDLITEGSINYNIRLDNVEGGGRLADSNIDATLTVRQNDDPVFFSNVFFNPQEGDTITLNVFRGGQRLGMAVVSFEVIYQSASNDDIIISPSNNVTMGDGQQLAQITLTVIDDSLPELMEEVRVRLVSAIGDAVVSSTNNMAIISIQPSDEPNGVFQFISGNTDVTATEGTNNIDLRVQRLFGTFDTVMVEWQILQYVGGSLQPAPAQQDFSAVAGVIQFAPGVSEQNISLNILQDGLPELEENFAVQLNKTFGGTPGARLGSYQVTNLTVPENDDPYGVFRFTPTSENIEVGEDLPSGDPNNGTGTFFVQRNGGTFNSISVLWEVLPSGTPALPSMTDLLLMGDDGADVQTVSSRPNTGTRAVRFTGSSTSVVTVPAEFHPVISGNFAISLWVNLISSSSGMLVAKASPDGTTRYYSFAITADGSNYILQFFYLPSTMTSGFSVVEVSISQSTLQPNRWYSIILNIANGQLSYFIDGSLITSRTLASSTIRDELGVLTAGGLSSAMFFSGTVQDVRIYHGSLTQQEITTISSDSASSDITPISGVALFPSGIALASFTISSVDDDIPEPSEIFNLYLLANSFRGRIESPGDNANLTVLKSDSSNGVFGFSPSSLSFTQVEGGGVSLIIERSIGTFGSVDVSWQVRELNNSIEGAIASDDFSPSSGVIRFNQGNVAKTLVLLVVNENIPELASNYTVRLLAATSDDGYISTTPTSGASVNNSLSTVRITVPENDFPYGVLQFATSPPNIGDLFTSQATSIPSLNVKESVGSITVYIVRAQGMIGTVRTELITEDGTAIGGMDYVSAAAPFVFAEGERYKTMEIQILDDTVPELGKQFSVNLTNPTGDPQPPALGVASTLLINILPSDNALGVFGFANNSLSVVVAEASGGTLVSLTIARSGGSLGGVDVYWQVDGPTADITPLNGMVTFGAGQTEGSILLTITDDMNPELLKVYNVMLLNASGVADIDSATGTAVLSVSANDYPYGLFTFSMAFRPLNVDETAGNVTVIVTREFGTIGTVTINYMSLSLPPADNIATADDDFEPISGTLTFAPNVTTQSFILPIVDDDLPELAETVYVVISNPILIGESPMGTGPDVGPSVSQYNNASIVIRENDNAQGVVEFNSTVFYGREGESSFIYVKRSAGTFGEIMVVWRAQPRSASINDFFPQSAIDSIPAGSSISPLTLFVFDDTIPEFAEDFDIEIISVEGGGVLGDITMATVTILPSDDPNGVFEFSSASLLREVNEPEGGIGMPVTLLVQRNGGSTGVSQVDWSISRSDGSPVAGDVQPTSGSLQFITGLTSRSITISILPDNVPEITEVLLVNLTTASGGARIGEQSTARVSVLPNDKPYGIVSMELDEVVVTEEPGSDRVYYVPVTRSEGTFNDVQVVYNIHPSILRDLSKFSGPTSNISPPASARVTQYTNFATTDYDNECATVCVQTTVLCSAFVVTTSPPLCEIYSANITSAGSIARTGTQYFEPLPGELGELMQHLATPIADFEFVVGGNTTILAGSRNANISVTIEHDDIPELNENFTVTLQAVTALGDDVSSDPTDLPTLGTNIDTTVVIEENDDPYGRFVVYYDSRQQVARIPEPQGAGSLAVMLTVEREAGLVGNVQVKWTATGVTASSEDFTGTGTELDFADGESRKTITVLVNPDDIPEADESIQLHLSDATQGAVVGPANASMVTIIIEANDNAAGIYGFAPNSRAATISEGNVISLLVERSVGKLGDVVVYWNISGLGDMANDFHPASGNILFVEGQSQANITVAVVADQLPEVAELFTLRLEQATPQTSNVGEAVLDLLAVTATLTIRASDNPHGVVQFQPDSAVVSANEETSVSLTVIRTFGTIGAIRISYQAMMISNSSQGDVLEATAGVDFNDANMTVDLLDGQPSTTILAPVINDVVPELAEVFSIQILSAHLISDPSTVVPLGNLTEAEVTILPSDNPQGVFNFPQNMANISENTGMVDLPVQRDAGTFGIVGVLYLISRTSTDINDFSAVTSGSLEFAAGESMKVIPIDILDDDIPELDEMFCVQLFTPTGGASLGPVNETCITILSNDDPHGVFRFDANSQSVGVDEAMETVMNENVAVLTVLRDRGTFGAVTIPFTVEPAGQNDLTSQVSVVSFTAGQTTANIMLTAVRDDSPELDEIFSVRLSQPIGGGRLDDNSMLSVAEVTVRENQDPYGVLQITTSNGQSSLSVEEDSVSLTLVVERSFPSFGTITVVVATVNGTATDDEDFDPILTTLSFEPNATQQTLTVNITNDLIPEVDETFTVALQSPTGGSRVGPNGAVNITILTNDAAHGQIRFAPASLSVVVSEGEANTPVTLLCLRDEGTFGVVRLSWSIVGDHNAGEVTPLSGEVVFMDGESMSTITLIVQADSIPELNEVSRVSLTGILENGVPPGGDPSRGATTVTGQITSFITVTANDAPHGVVMWTVNSTDTPEVDEMDTVIELSIVREFGTIGDIVISYMTRMDDQAPSDQQATSDQDFIAITDTVTIPANMTSASVSVTIRHDHIPELTESFFVVITNVQLVNESDRMGSPSNSPRVATDGGTTIVNILENDDSRGTLHMIDTALTVDEAVGTVCITLNRTGGTFGTIGAMFTVTPSTATGGGVDYTPDSGTVMLLSGVQMQCLPINIINDITPESAESFSVMLTSPVGGAQLGNPLTATITISQNDDLNGVFSFAPGSLVVIIPENGVATLVIERSISSVGVVTVDWEVSSDGTADLVPVNGNVTFQDGDTQASFQISAINDGLVELYEAYTVSLSSADNGGRISSPSTASIAIPASQSPPGVIGFAPYQLETVVVQEGASFIASVVRSSGMFGVVVIQWQITPADTTTFPVTSGTGVMGNGELSLNMSIQTTQDTIPEVARQYTFLLVSAGEATIDTARSQLTVVVAASDSPHGIINFLPPLARTLSEDAGTVAVSVFRSGGLVGELTVNISVIDITAMMPSDFIIANNTLTIGNGEASGSINTMFVADDIPEEDESFRIRLNSVELAADINGGRDFNFAGDATEIDSVPQLGPNTESVITIQKNDDANGVVSLTQNLYTAVEGGAVMIEVARAAGTFGSVGVSFTVTPGTAQGSGVDFSTPSSPLIIPPGQSSGVISIPIVDDSAPEFQESFSVALNSVSGGARLSGLAMTNIIINASDNPTGRLRFSAFDLAGRVVDNPTSVSTSVMLTVERQGGTSGAVQVSWQVDGPNPGMEFSDIDAASLQGTITLLEGQSSGTITITILPSSSPEPAEVFTVRLHSPTNSATIDSDASTVQITVTQQGMPYGTFGFFGEALNIQNITEADIVQTVNLPIARTEGNLGDVVVSFVVTAVLGQPAGTDVSPVNGTITVMSGVSFSSINIQIIPDVLPESAEVFTVTITSLSGGMLDAARSTAQFRILASDSPYGLFGILNPSLSLQSVGSTLNRVLGFTISRDLGSVSSVMVEVTISYQQELTAMFFESPVTRTLIDGQTTEGVSLTGTSDGYLAPGANLTISITALTLIGSSDGGEGPPEVSAAFGTAQLTITSAVANPTIRFADSSLEVSVSNDVVFTNNVALTVTRQGSTGSMMVRWSTGVQLAGAANGSITPASGSVTSSPGQTTSTLTFTVVPADPPIVPQVFAVRLEAISQSPLEARAQPGVDIAYIEPRGVVKLAFPEYSGLEGLNAAVTVSRLFGSQEDIQVFGVASETPATNIPFNKIAAIAGTDFSTEVQSVVIPSGSISGSILVPLRQNFVENQLKVFSFRLTSVTRLGQQGNYSSPRLSSVNLDAIVTIIDDEAGAGEFGFFTPNITVNEANTLVQIIITRIGANVGSVTLQLSVTPGRRDGSEPATAGVDYDAASLPSMVTFADQESQKILSIGIIDDSTPELREYFTVHLANPQGGSALINPTRSTLEVLIAPSDSPYGVFSFADTTLTIIEQDSLTGILTVQRVFTFAQAVTIDVVVNVTGTSLIMSYPETITFEPSDTEKTITFVLNAGQVPAPQASFSVRLSSAQEGISLINNVATVTAIASTTSIFSFQQNSRNAVVDQPMVTLVIQRSGGLQFSSTVQYTTLNNTVPISVGDLTFQPALGGVHYLPITAATATFNQGQASSSVVITVFPSTLDGPRAFRVSLQSDTNLLQNSEALVVITPVNQPALRDLYRNFLTIYPSASSQLLINISTNIETNLRRNAIAGSNSLHAEALLSNVKQVLALSASNGLVGSTPLKSSLTNIFNLIIANANFSQQTQYVPLMKMFAYSLLVGKTCSNTQSSREVISVDSYYLEATRLPSANVARRSFFSVAGGDFVTFPASGLSGIQGVDECVNVSYIEFKQPTLFARPVLNSKVLSVGIQGVFSDLQSPVVYRIYSNEMILPSRNDCVIWQDSATSAGAWDSSVCITRTSVFEQDFIECECRRMGDFAATIPPNYGWTLPAPITCAIVLVIIILVIILHLIFIRRILIATQILVLIFVALGLFELIAMIDMFTAPTANDAGCIVLGLALQLIILLLFMWILALMLSFWVKLMDFMKGKEPLIAYIVICCVCTAIAIVIVICTMLICLYGVQLEWTQIYGRIGDICFMPRVEVAALSTALPILLVVLVVITLLVHSCISWSRWEDFNSLYNETYNRTDIPLVMVFFGIIFVTVLLGGLHMYLQTVYWFSLFVISNIILGLYVLIVYFCISLHTLTWKRTHDPLKEDLEPAHLPEDSGEWPYDDSHSNLTPQSQSIEGSEKHVAAMDRQTADGDHDDDGMDSLNGSSGEYNFVPGTADREDSEEEGSENQMDDLMFALRTGTSYPQDDDDDQQPLFEMGESRKKPSSSEELQLRRISIADTHV